jgi:hypothetical protein
MIDVKFKGKTLISLHKEALFLNKLIKDFFEDANENDKEHEELNLDCFLLIDNTGIPELSTILLLLKFCEYSYDIYIKGLLKNDEYAFFPFNEENLSAFLRDNIKNVEINLKLILAAHFMQNKSSKILFQNHLVHQIRGLTRQEILDMFDVNE